MGADQLNGGATQWWTGGEIYICARTEFICFVIQPIRVTQEVVQLDRTPDSSNETIGCIHDSTRLLIVLVLQIQFRSFRSQNLQVLATICEIILKHSALATCVFTK